MTPLLWFAPTDDLPFCFIGVMRFAVGLSSGVFWCGALCLFGIASGHDTYCHLCIHVPSRFPPFYSIKERYLNIIIQKTTKKSII